MFLILTTVRAFASEQSFLETLSSRLPSCFLLSGACSNWPQCSSEGRKGQRTTLLRVSLQVSRDWSLHNPCSFYDSFCLWRNYVRYLREKKKGKLVSLRYSRNTRKAFPRHGQRGCLETLPNTRDPLLSRNLRWQPGHLGKLVRSSRALTMASKVLLAIMTSVSQGKSDVAVTSGVSTGHQGKGNSFTHFSTVERLNDGRNYDSL